MIREKVEKRMKRHRRVRAKILGSVERPRLSVFRSNFHIYAQLIDDLAGKTLASFSDAVLGGKKSKSKDNKKTTVAHLVGRSFGDQILKKGFKRIVFDRGGYKYHGRVKALAEGLREAGVEF